MSTKQTEALKLALEALEYERGANNPLDWHHDKTITAIRKALAEQPAQQQEPAAIKWTLDGDKTCRYNNWLGETPFGRILITWKGWKQHHDADVDAFPGDFDAHGSPDEVKEMCEAEFAKRSGYTSPPASKPLTDEVLQKHWPWRWPAQGAFVRASADDLREFAHGIKGDA